MTRVDIVTTGQSEVVARVWQCWVELGIDILCRSKADINKDSIMLLVTIVMYLAEFC